MDITELAERLQRQKRAWKQLARSSGVSYFTLTKIARGTTKNPSLETVNKLLPHLHDEPAATQQPDQAAA